MTNNSKDLSNVAARLETAANTYNQRNKQYGNTYKMHGNIMNELFPKGITLKGKEDHNRYAIINTIVSKLNRYCNNFANGGHKDSIHDLGVYCFMLEELDDEYQEHYNKFRPSFMQEELSVIYKDDD